MKKNKNGFTLVELLIYILISIFLIYWLTSSFQMLSNLIFSSDNTTKSFESLENYKDDIELFKAKYNVNLYSTWNVFSNSEFWFESCVFSNKENTWWLILWVVEKTQKKLKLWVYESVDYFTPFILEVNTPVNNLSINDDIFTLWNARYYQDINLLKFSCLLKQDYTKINLTLLNQIEKWDIWKNLIEWNKNSSSKKIYLTIIK